MVNLQIIGVQKAGTSALAHFLSQHPDICLVEGKEGHVFDHPTFHLQANKARQARLKYQKKLSHYKGEKYICDATPITLFREQYLRYCVNYNPSAKFIVILRDPVLRAISHYSMSSARGAEQKNMLLAFILEPFRLKKYRTEHGWPFDSPARNQSYLSRGFYKNQLAVLHSHVPKENILIITQESLRQNHQNTMNKVFRFLNIKAATIPKDSIFEGEKPRFSGLNYIAKLYATAVFLLMNKRPYNSFVDKLR